MLTKRKILLMLVFFLVGCASTGNTKITQDNILKLRQGMTSEEVVEIFGRPHKTTLRTCGRQTDKPWDCMFWFYVKINTIILIFEVNDTRYGTRYGIVYDATYGTIYGTMYLRRWTIR